LLGIGKLVSKITKYNYVLLLESLWYLLKWDKIIRKQAYASWKKNLDSAKASPATNKIGFNDQPDINHYLQKISAHINVIVRHSPRELNCMRRCLALKSMIERRHGHCKMHIGVKLETQTSDSPETQTPPKIAAHAWITLNQTIINDTPDKIAEYKEITSNSKLFESAKETK
jgi:hypothetical protein